MRNEEMGKGSFEPVSPEKEEVSLIVKCYHLASLEFGQRRKQCLEESTNRVSESCHETVQHEFWIVRRGSCMALVAM